MNTQDRIAWVRVSSCMLPLATPISDAKVLTGRQKAMTEIVLLFAEVQTADGHEGLGFSYAKRAGGPGQFAHEKEIAPALIGEDPSDIARLWNKLCWAGASVGRSGLAVQAIGAFDVALYDLKARRAGLSLAKLLGAYRVRWPATTPRAAFCTRRWSSCWSMPRPRSSAASAASSSRWGSPIASSTSGGSRPCASNWAAAWR